MNMVLGTDLAPKGVSGGQFLGAWALVCDLGAVCGPLFVGAVSHATTLDEATTYTGVIGFIGCAYYTFAVKETLHKEVGELPSPTAGATAAAAAAAAAAVVVGGTGVELGDTVDQLRETRM
jgi:hypothetical protein